MSDLSRRLAIASAQCSIQYYAGLFGDAAKEIDNLHKVAEELEEKASRPWSNREPPHCPTCDCGSALQNGTKS